MNKTVLKRLKKYAEKLPEVYKNVKVCERKMGSEILKDKPDMKDEKGQPLDAHKMYKITSLKPKRIGLDDLKTIYNSDKKAGWAAVEGFIIYLNSAAKRQKEISESVAN